MSAPRLTLLCLASYFKGNRFLQRAKEEGASVLLLTVEHMLQEPWARDSVDEVFALPSFDDRQALLNAVAYLLRSRRIDRVVALDDFDVEVAALLREHFRWPGHGETRARLFRDKLAMRARAKELSIRQPAFTALFRDDDVARFVDEVEGPWLLKPRFQASAVGIQKLSSREEAWQAIADLGDERSFHLLERMIPGDMYHVDSLTVGGRILFAEVNKYHRPLLEVAQGGGIYATRTLPREDPLIGALKGANTAVLDGFGIGRGASHTEVIVSADDGEPYFVETSSRVGGAHIAEMVEAATGLNLWSEWAKLEVVGDDGDYVLPTPRADYGGVIISLARQERPDTSGFDDPEIVERLDMKHHIGLVVRSSSAERVEALLTSYRERIERDFHAVLPPSDRPSS